MKNLELNQMENIIAGTPNGNEVMCFTVSTILGFLNPIAGIISGAACLFLEYKE